MRTCGRVKPVLVSPGHCFSLHTAIALGCRCSDRTRIPNPTREAELLVGQLKHAYLGS